MPKVRPEDRTLGSGLEDDFDGVIVGIEFKPPGEKYAAAAGGIKDPHMFVTMESPEYEDLIIQPYSIGKDWEIVRDGKEVVNKNPNIHVFQSKCRGGDLVIEMETIIGNGDKAKGEEKLFSRDHYMTEEEFYIGYNLHWKRQPRPKVEGGTSDVLLPIEFLGEAKTTAKKGAQAADSSLLDEFLKLAPGKNLKELRLASTKELDKTAPGYKTFIASALSGSLIDDLTAEGRLVEGDDGKFM